MNNTTLKYSNIHILLVTILLFTITACQSKVSKNNAKITFESSEHNFGELELNANGEYNFTFSNPGDEPLVIQHVKTSCGCTVPQWPVKPIKPGKHGEIQISYDTSHPGMFQKTVSVFYNGKNSPETLIIKGRINYPTQDQTNQTIE